MDKYLCGRKQKKCKHTISIVELFIEYVNDVIMTKKNFKMTSFEFKIRHK